MALTQKDRLMSIHTPLGEDVFLLAGFSGQEGLSQLFRFELDLLVEMEPIRHEDLVGKAATIQLTLRGNESRYFNGFINRVTQVSSETGIFHYRAEMVPWLWFLTRTADCRIFQNKTIPDIVTQIFQEYGFSDYTFQVGSYDPREYCVQYRETDFNFVSRLMEQYGLFYFWKHEKDKHTLVVADTSSAHQAVPFQATVSWEAGGSTSHEQDVITSLEFETDIRPGKFTHRDFNFTQSVSGRIIEHTESSIIDIAGNSALETYDYPGEFSTKKQGEALAKVRMQEEEAQHFVITGASNCKAFTSGYKFTLEGYLPAEWNQEYVLTSIHHQGSMGNTYSTGRPKGGEESYANTFSCIPATVTFRPPQLTPKPVVQGPQTAIVVGKSGEEIWTDKYGRVKVLFHWNRESEGDENSSCWVRVSQLNAGKQWGAMFLPRIGQEVIVEFLEGDPDQPVITGRLYNEECQPPYELPAEQTKSTIKSNSSKGGEGFNEIRFEDKKDEEQIFIHAQKNMDIRVKNDVFQNVDGNTHLDVKKDQHIHIEKDRHDLIDQDLVEKIKRDHHLTIDGKQAVKIVGCQSTTVEDEVIQVYKADYSQQTTGDTYIKAANIVIEATTNITIKVGQSFIAIENGGITIGSNGPIELDSKATATVKGVGGLTLESTATAELKSPMTTVKGDGMLTVKGGVVMIN